MRSQVRSLLTLLVIALSVRIFAADGNPDEALAKRIAAYDRSPERQLIAPAGVANATLQDGPELVPLEYSKTAVNIKLRDEWFVILGDASPARVFTVDTAGEPDDDAVALEQLLAKLPPGTTWKRIFQRSAAELFESRKRAEAFHRTPTANLSNWFSVALPSEADVYALRGELGESPLVEYVEIVVPWSYAGEVQPDGTRRIAGNSDVPPGQHFYGTLGIPAVWSDKGIVGRDAKMAIMPQGLPGTSQPDLPDIVPVGAFVAPPNEPGDSAAFALAGAPADDVGITGIAFGADFFAASAVAFNPAIGKNDILPAAGIEAAVAKMGGGGVIAIPQVLVGCINAPVGCSRVYSVPVDHFGYKSTWDAIQDAVSNHVSVFLEVGENAGITTMEPVEWRCNHTSCWNGAARAWNGALYVRSWANGNITEYLPVLNIPDNFPASGHGSVAYGAIAALIQSARLQFRVSTTGVPLAPLTPAQLRTLPLSSAIDAVEATLSQAASAPKLRVQASLLDDELEAGKPIKRNETVTFQVDNNKNEAHTFFIFNDDNLSLNITNPRVVHVSGPQPDLVQFARDGGAPPSSISGHFGGRFVLQIEPRMHGTHAFEVRFGTNDPDVQGDWVMKVNVVVAQNDTPTLRIRDHYLQTLSDYNVQLGQWTHPLPPIDPKYPPSAGFIISRRYEITNEGKQPLRLSNFQTSSNKTRVRIDWPVTWLGLQGYTRESNGDVVLERNASVWVTVSGPPEDGTDYFGAANYKDIDEPWSFTTNDPNARSIQFRFKGRMMKAPGHFNVKVNGQDASSGVFFGSMRDEEAADFVTRMVIEMSATGRDVLVRAHDVSDSVADLANLPDHDAPGPGPKKWVQLKFVERFIKAESIVREGANIITGVVGAIGNRRSVYKLDWGDGQMYLVLRTHIRGVGPKGVTVWLDNKPISDYGRSGGIAAQADGYTAAPIGTTLDLGVTTPNVPIGRVFEIRNTSTTKPVTITNFAVTGDFVGELSTPQIAPGATGQFKIVFLASRKGGKYTGSVSFNADTVPASEADTFFTINLEAQSGDIVPTVNTFTATPSAVAAGQQATITWSVSNATSVSISQGIGTVAASGSKTVTVNQTTDYEITAINGAETVRRPLKVEVVGNGPAGSPTIAGFRAAPDSVQAGQPSTLTWDVQNATSISITPGGTVTGTSLNVTPSKTTTYILRATNASGTSSAAATVYIGATSPPVIASFTANPKVLSGPGQSTVLSWDVTNAATVSIDHSIGPVQSSGTHTIAPSVSTRYTLTAENSAGKTTKTEDVTVQGTTAGGTPPSIQSFTATSLAAAAGEPVTLSWNVANADVVIIAPPLTVVNAADSRAVSSQATTTYTLFARNAAGSVSQEITVSVSGGPAVPTINEFIVQPQPVVLGGTGEIRWNTSGASSVTIAPDIGAVNASGVKSIQPGIDSLLVLTATNGAGSVSRAAVIDVEKGPNSPLSRSLEVILGDVQNGIRLEHDEVTQLYDPIQGYASGSIRMHIVNRTAAEIVIGKASVFNYYGGAEIFTLSSELKNITLGPDASIPVDLAWKGPIAPRGYKAYFSVTTLTPNTTGSSHQFHFNVPDWRPETKQFRITDGGDAALDYDLLNGPYDGVNATWFNLGLADSTANASKLIKVHNDGSAPLQVTQAWCNAYLFSIRPTPVGTQFPVSIPANGSVTLRVSGKELYQSSNTHCVVQVQTPGDPVTEAAFAALAVRADGVNDAPYPFLTDVNSGAHIDDHTGDPHAEEVVTRLRANRSATKTFRVRNIRGLDLHLEKTITVSGNGFRLARGYHEGGRTQLPLLSIRDGNYDEAQFKVEFVGRGAGTYTGIIKLPMWASSTNALPAQWQHTFEIHWKVVVGNGRAKVSQGQRELDNGGGFDAEEDTTFIIENLTDVSLNLSGLSVPPHYTVASALPRTLAARQTGTFSVVKVKAAADPEGPHFVSFNMDDPDDPTFRVRENHKPVAVNDTATVESGGNVPIDVTANDTDADGDGLSLTPVPIVTQPSKGVVVETENSVLVYAANAGATGGDRFVYEVSDGNGGVARAEVLVTIGAENRNPVANPDSVSTKPGVPVNIHVTANDVDPDGDPVLLITDPVVVPPASGAAVKLDGGTIRYTPNENFTGIDTFTYEAGDTFGKRARAEVTVLVGNTKPVAAADFAVTKPGRAVRINVTANDSDPDGDDITLIADPVVVVPQHGGAVKIDGDTIEYTPGAAFTGTDTFTYEIGDGFGMRARAVVTVTVANAKPVATGDAASTQRNKPVKINVVGNDADPDGDLVWLIADAIAVPPSHGTAVRTNDHEVTYTPATGYVGIDTFEYEIGDGSGGRDRAVVTVTIANFGPPVARNDRAYTKRGTSVTIDVLENDVDPDGQAFALTAAAITAQPKHGSVARASDRTVTYTPFATYTGNDSFQYEIVDAVGKKDKAWVTVHVGRTRLAPVAVDDAAETPTNQSRSINVLANDSSPDGDAIFLTTVPILEYPRWGNVTRVSDTTLAYTAKNGFTGTDRFKYQITDSEGRKGSAWVTISVTQTNEKPVAVADAAATHMNQPVTIDVTANDSDPDGDPVSLIPNPIRTQPQHGTAVRVSASRIAYSPEQGFAGTDSFEYEIGDGNGGRSRALVNISVSDTNHPPDAEDDTAVTTAGAAVTINVTANDSDTDGDRVLLIANPIITAPANGTATKINGAEITYRPRAGFTGTDTFEYEVGDGHAGRDRALVTITVGEGEVNHNPVAVQDEVSARVNTPIDIEVTANDSDPDGDSVFLVTNAIETAPSHGTAVRIDGRTVRYTPATDYTGVDTFQYEIGDGRGKRSRAWVRVTIDDANSRPVAVNDVASTRPGVAVTVRVIANDTDPDGDPIHITANGILTPPEHGTAVQVAGHSITYTPEAGFRGTDRLRYQIGDGRGLRSKAWLNITVSGNASNAALIATLSDGVPPIADNDLGEGGTDTAVPVVVLANDITIDGKAVILSAEPVITAPESGTVTRTSDTTLTFTPAAGFRGNDRFEYEVVDAGGGTTRAWATVQIPGNNQPPVAVADEVTIAREASFVVRPLLNDSDPDNDPLSLSLRAVTVQPQHGTVRRDGNLELVYAPEPGFIGDDAFTYEVSDERGGLAEATVTVHVLNATNPPAAANDSGNGQSGQAIVIDVLANDSDPDGEPLRISASTRPLHGTIVWSEEGGTVTYRSDAGYTGLDKFSYTISDTDGLTAQAEVSVTVIAVNHPPVLSNDSVETKTRTPVLVGVLANDWDPEWKRLVVTAVSTPTGGTATIHRGESVLYEPGPNFAGTDSFEYTVSDGSSTPYRASVTVTVLNAPPQPRSEILSAPEDTWIGYQSYNVLGNDTDPDGDELHISDVEQPDHGTFQISPDKQQFSFKGPENWSGMATFHYTVSDPFGASVRVLSQIRVNAVNDAPVAVDDTFPVYKNQLLSIPEASVVANDTDLEGHTIRIHSIGAPANGTAQLLPDGSIEYRPHGEFAGADSFEYTIEDSGGGAYGTGRIHVDVLPDTRPVASFTVTCTYLTCAFDASASTDDRGIVSYQWTLGDHSAAAGKTFSHTYTAAGPYAVRLTIEDALGQTAATQQTVIVTAPNVAPVAQNDAFSGGEDLPLSFAATQLLANDSDADGTSLRITAVTQPSKGTLTHAADFATFSFAPPANWFGSTSVTYTIADADGATAQATVTLTITSINDAPVAVNDSFSVYKNQLLTLTEAQIIGNDTDVEGHAVVLHNAGAAANGTVTRLANGSIEYQPHSEFAGADFFEYTIGDSAGGAYATGRVNITVLQDTAPVANFTFSCTNLVCAFDASSSTDDRGIVSYQWTMGNNGAASGRTPSYPYAAPGTYNVRLTVEDVLGQRHAVQKTVVVTCPNPSIAAQPTARTITAGQPTTFSVTATNATSYQWYQGAAGVTTTPVGTNSSSLTVTPAATASYWVRITNSCGSTNSAAAAVTVCVPPSIATQPASQTINSGMTATLTVAASGSGPFAYQWYEGASGVTTTPVGTNSSSFTTPALAATKSYWVRVTSACNGGVANSSAATVTVTAVQIARRQKAAQTANSQQSITTSWTQPTQQGSLLVAVVSALGNGGYPIATFTPPAGWVHAATSEWSNVKTSIYYYPNNPGGRTAETFATGPSGFRDQILQLAEYTGVATVSPLDRTITAGGASNTGTLHTGYTPATVQGRELVITALMTNVSTTFSAPSDGFVELHDHTITWSTLAAAMHERIVTATGAYGHSASVADPGAEWVGAAATFKAAN